MPRQLRSPSEEVTGTDVLLGLGAANRARDAVGVYSICSANRLVLEAGMLQALRDATPVLIESTSNQVNQFGGYTGMTPADFRAFVGSVAQAMGLAQQRVILGGDHLGPHPWRSEPAASAMVKARDLVRECVLAGYTKIHLDASMRCADDPPGRPLDERVVSERAADLCSAGESAHAELQAGATAQVHVRAGRGRRGRSTAPRPVYVIGSEVPIPGGELAGQSAPGVTRPLDVERTLALARAAFHPSLESAWQRVIAVVVQPGVEFGDATVFEYDRPKAADLSAFIELDGRLVYEAHSTDYQTPGNLRRMVEDHFAILKVGPGLTFAMREAIFALECMEREWLGGRNDSVLSGLRDVLQQTMRDRPGDWKPYYRGDEDELRLARDFSFSDRSRYYWPLPEVKAALDRLCRNLSDRPVPLTLLSQYLPVQYEAVRAGALDNQPADLIRHRVLEVATTYASACRMR